MKTIINYFNDNAFFASVITLILSTVITIIVNRHERIQRRKDIVKDQKREEVLNKGMFRVNKHKKNNNIEELDLIFTDYKIENNNGIEECIYNKKILNKKNNDYIYFPLKNIGNKEICELYIASNNREMFVLIESERIKRAYKNKYSNFVVGYYDKILPGESILIDLNFYKGSKIFSLSAELTVYYRDGYGNFYKQPLFLGEERLEGPYIMDYKDYRKETSLLL